MFGPYESAGNSNVDLPTERFGAEHSTPPAVRDLLVGPVGRLSREGLGAFSNRVVVDDDCGIIDLYDLVFSDVPVYKAIQVAPAHFQNLPELVGQISELSPEIAFIDNTYAHKGERCPYAGDKVIEQLLANSANKDLLIVWATSEAQDPNVPARLARFASSRILVIDKLKPNGSVNLIDVESVVQITAALYLKLHERVADLDALKMQIDPTQFVKSPSFNDPTTGPLYHSLLDGVAKEFPDVGRYLLNGMLLATMVRLGKAELTD